MDRADGYQPLPSEDCEATELQDLTTAQTHTSVTSQQDPLPQTQSPASAQQILPDQNQSPAPTQQNQPAQAHVPAQYQAQNLPPVQQNQAISQYPGQSQNPSATQYTPSTQYPASGQGQYTAQYQPQVHNPAQPQYLVPAQYPPSVQYNVPGQNPAPVQYPTYTPAPNNLTTPQQQGNNIMTIGQQPVQTQPVSHVNVPTQRSRPLNELQLGIAIVCTVCSACIPFMWPSLLCLIPAVILAAVGMGSVGANDYRRGATFCRAALGLNIAAIVYNVLIIVVVIIAVGVAFGTGANCRYVVAEDSTCGYDEYGTAVCSASTGTYEC